MVSYIPLVSTYTLALASSTSEAPVKGTCRRDYLIECVKRRVDANGYFVRVRCSPQVLYRLLDELDVCPGLRGRTKHHIVACYTIKNVRPSFGRRFGSAR